MDCGTFIGTYNTRVDDWYKRIADATDPQVKKRLEDDLHKYMTDCIPYLMKYTRGDTDEAQETYDPIFKTKITKGIQRKEIYYDYMRNVENYKGSDFQAKVRKTFNEFVCKSCGKEELKMDYKSSQYVCLSCGVCEYYLGDELTYKEEQESSEKIVNNSYKRDNHLNEWILQFQGRETTNIPNEVIDQLRAEFKKQKIKNVNEICQKKVKSLLRKLRLSKYYEHSAYITNILNGFNPPQMSQELEDKLRHMFREIQEPFDKHCPSTRSNFLSYSYVLYKFCELLGEDEYLPYFPLLKSKEKLRQQDVIWKAICGEVLWEYIATV